MNAFLPAPILLPEDVEMYRWAVIACDQFTSDLGYWKRVRETVGDARSTLHMILPEAELGHDEEAAVRSINAAMDEYLNCGVFREYPSAYVYVERTLTNGRVRAGLVGMVDLEQYDYSHNSTSAVRATEKTVLSRIPPRQRIRKDASIEFPHVLMLCDDHEKRLIEPISLIKDTLPKLYDFDLMEGGGHITGWLLTEEAVRAFDERLTLYAAGYEEKYADLPGAKVLFAVGDGNHSLATAKSCYETLKLENPDMDMSVHPARYALVELENIHDPSLEFEPIHRIITGTDCVALLDALGNVCADDGFEVGYVCAGRQGKLVLDRSKGELAVAVLQEALDAFLAENAGEIDYIHGDAEVIELAQQGNAIGFLLPAMEKGQLFRGVISGGVLPRKTFSMGHAREKRYYLEGRSIK